MRFSAKATSDGVTERLFMLGDVPGVVWAAEDVAGPRPLVLLGHGGGQHKTAPPLAARARRYVTRCGFAVAAIDAPGWGDRRVPAAYDLFNAEIEELSAAGKSLGDVFARRGVVAAALAVPEWQATIRALAELDWIGPGPVGYWGVSLGTAIGLPLVAAEPRISAAVLGLMGHETLALRRRRGSPSQSSSTCSGTTRLVPRESGLALFDTIGSADKTLHANPGRHAEVPGFEVDSSERFFARHLGS